MYQHFLPSQLYIFKRLLSQGLENPGLFGKLFAKPVHFCAPVSKDRGGGIFFTIVRLSVCLYVCLHKLDVKTTFSHYSLTNLLTRLIFGRHISSIRICWYQGQGHLQRSRSNINVVFLKKRPFRGHSYFTNTYCFCYNF